MLYLFDDFALDTERRELRRKSVSVPLEPRVFDLLRYLIDHRERVISKDELLETIWNGRIVSESAITTTINAARAAVGDSGALQHIIRTLPRRGLRFVGELRIEETKPAASVQSQRAEGFEERPNSAPTARSPWAVWVAAALAAAFLVVGLSWFRSPAPLESPATATAAKAPHSTNADVIAARPKRIGMAAFKVDARMGSEGTRVGQELTDGVRAVLAALPDVRVVSLAESANAMGGAAGFGLDPDRPGERLAYIVDGYVTAPDGRLGTAIEVRDGATRVHLWTIRLGRPRSEAERIPGEIVDAFGFATGLLAAERLKGPQRGCTHGISRGWTSPQGGQAFMIMARDPQSPCGAPIVVSTEQNRPTQRLEIGTPPQFGHAWTRDNFYFYQPNAGIVGRDEFHVVGSGLNNEGIDVAVKGYVRVVIREAEAVRR